MAVSSTAIAGNTTGWRAKLRKASFRGVEFGVTDAEGEGGRRTVTHEFPQRDLPYVEDMGLATAKFTLQAFVLGADYMAIEGDTTQNGKISSTGDQIAGGVSQINHPHTGVQPGSGQTGKPVGGA